MSVAQVRTTKCGETFVTRTRDGKLIAYKVHGGSSWVSEEIAVETLSWRARLQIRIDHGLRRHRCTPFNLLHRMIKRCDA
jgi:hypothetical protein